jgi:hypothetical protein
MNDLQFAGTYQCLPIRCSGRLISLQNEHPIFSTPGFTLSNILIVIYNAFRLKLCPACISSARVIEENTVSNNTSIVARRLLPREPVRLRSLPKKKKQKKNTTLHATIFPRPATLFQDHKLHVAGTSQVRGSAILILTVENYKLKLNSVALVRKRTIQTERPPFVGEVSANFCG